MLVLNFYLIFLKNFKKNVVDIEQEEEDVDLAGKAKITQKSLDNSKNKNEKETNGLRVFLFKKKFK